VTDTTLLDQGGPFERRSPRAGLLAGLARRLVLGRLGAVTEGDLSVVEGGETSRFGRHGDPLRATITVHDPRFWGAIAGGGTNGAAEAFMEGWWSADDLVAVVRIAARVGGGAAGLEAGRLSIAQGVARAAHALRRNTRRGARRNIEAHYDLGNDFYALFLDETMSYSAAIFERPDATLREASEAKIDRACRRLGLGPGMRLLEIGSGWGALAIHAAQHYGCRVATTTLSRQQHALAMERVRAAGLEGRVEVLLEDYRDLRGTYDRVDSIEMIEAVGWEYYEPFFRACADRLAPDGLALVQTITIKDREYERAKREVDFIKKHVFPGGCIPSVGALVDAAARGGDLGLVGLEEIGLHYAQTLRAWRERFLARRAEARALGYGERFLRLWEYYLAYCEGGFLERYIGNAQMLFAKPGAVPPGLPEAIP
jgi:cyclopropane-fatty-acyl-phospholipid synthase